MSKLGPNWVRKRSNPHAGGLHWRCGNVFAVFPASPAHVPIPWLSSQSEVRLIIYHHTIPTLSCEEPKRPPHIGNNTYLASTLPHSGIALDNRRGESDESDSPMCAAMLQAMILVAP